MTPTSSTIVSRRAVLHAGLGAAAIGLLRLGGMRTTIAGAAPCHPPLTTTRLRVMRGHPVLELPFQMPSIDVDGIPFAARWTGDSFADGVFPFHSCENCFPGGAPPEPTEMVEVAIIGGGLSGLATAHALRDRSIALFELRDRMGGTSMGERWRGTTCSLGSAYFIVPDEGSELDRLYQELGVWPGATVAPGELTAEIDGTVVGDLLEWSGFTEEERVLVRRYAEIVQFFARKSYPEIPLPRDGDSTWIRELDQNSLKYDLDKRLGAPLPPRLASAIQAYCYSSFGASWETISAAAGWNFIAAEEYGRIVLSGGNAGLASALWTSIATGEPHRVRPALRPRCQVVDVRLESGEVRVSWRHADGYSSLRARHVVFANSKFIAKWMLPQLKTLDAEKAEAVHQIWTQAYVVVNVLLDRRMAARFYDLFLLDGGKFPMDELAAESAVKVMDVIDGGFGDSTDHDSAIVTLYWPLPWPTGRATLIEEDSWLTYATKLVPQLKALLALIGVPQSSIHQVRMTRWGHALPIAKPSAIANGTCELLRRPIADRIWFVNQDNWMLPAVETCLQEAVHYSAQIRERL